MIKQKAVQNWHTRFKKLALGFSDDTCFHMGDVRRAKNAYSETLQTIK